MSLKAKLEAVIYAAEEPVTLNQLASLFAAEALEWKAEQIAASAQQAAEAAESQSLLGEEFAYLEPDAAASEPAQTEASEETVSELDSEASTEASAQVEPVAEPTAEILSETAEVPAVLPEDAPTAEVSQALLGEPISDQAAEPATEAVAETPVDSESELKRQARQRDREVRAILRQLLDEIIASYASDGRGVEIREIAGGYRMATKPECHDAVRLFVKSLKPALKLSLAALETLAVIAYKQPVTAPEVNEIRGVDSSGVFGSLLARKLIATAGRKQVIGRPMLYKTTKEFLLRFGLKDVAELPSMEEFEKMASIELDEPDTVSEYDQQFAVSQPEPTDPELAVVDESELESDQEFAQSSTNLPIEASDSGAVPESAQTPAVQEPTVADLPAQTPAEDTVETAAPEPAEMPAQFESQTAANVDAEVPAEMAASPSDTTEPVFETTPND